MRRAKRYYHGRTMCACRILSLRRRVAFAIACHVLSSCAPSFSISAIYVVFYSKPHPMPHVPLLASWRSLTWRSECDAFLEIMHIIRCRSFVCFVCFFNNRSMVGTSISSTQKVLTVLLLLSTYTQEVLRVKREFIIFPGIFFCMHKQMVIASGSDNNHVSSRHSPRHFPEGNLVYICLYIIWCDLWVKEKGTCLTSGAPHRSKRRFTKKNGTLIVSRV